MWALGCNKKAILKDGFLLMEWKRGELFGNYATSYQTLYP